MQNNQACCFQAFEHSKKRTWEFQGFFKVWKGSFKTYLICKKKGILRVYKNIVKTRPFIGEKRNEMLI